MNNRIFKTLFRFLLLERVRIAEAVYSIHRKQELIAQFDASKEIIFDLSDSEFIHLGDTLFYGMVGALLQSKNVSVRLKANKQNHLLLAVTFPNLATEATQSTKFITIGSPYSLFDNRGPFLFVGLGGVHQIESKQYPLALLNHIESLFSIGATSSSEYNECISKIRQNLMAFGARDIEYSRWFRRPLIESQKFLIVAPYLGSGRFRDLFKKKRRSIIEFARNLMREDSRLVPVLVGAASDPPLYISGNQLDIRGWRFDKVLRLVCSERSTKGVGFDNFWFHIFHLLDKKYYCKFRGRFTKSSKSLHFAMVNKAFCTSLSDDVEYI